MTAAPPDLGNATKLDAGVMTAAPLLEIENLTKVFVTRRGFPVPRTVSVRVARRSAS